MKLGIESLLSSKELLNQLDGKMVGLLAHPASVNHDLHHSVDLLAKHPKIKLSAAFGPQHGIRGDKQDNMIETHDELDPIHNIPVFSLYGKVRRPSPEMLSHCDIILVDLQDLGCRIYTFITTLLYLLEEGARLKKSIWILDRPNPAGRPVEGTRLRPGWESFVGAAPLPMRHGLTMGELAHYYVKHFKLEVDFKVVKMEGYNPDSAGQWGWPSGELSWVNPSPNASNLSMARCYAGTVLGEGTQLSEGRGTTRPLEIMGAPDIDFHLVLKKMNELAPQWLKGCLLRVCHFEPTFNKHAKKLCSGIQIHVDTPHYDHFKFQPFRLMSLMFKSIRTINPNYSLWRDFPYEYETTRLAIDIINGSEELRQWVDDSQSTPQDWDSKMIKNESSWIEERKPFLLY